MLMSHSKDILRTAPLKSSSLFGGLIKEVAETDRIDQTHMALSTNQKGFRNPPKRQAPKPVSAPPQKIPRLNLSAKPKFSDNRGRRPYRTPRGGPRSSANLPALHKTNP